MLDLLLNLMLCYLATPSNIIRKVKHYKETIIAIISLLTCVNHHLRLIVVWMFLSRTRPAVSSIEPHWLIGSKPVEKQLQQYYISLSPASVVERLAEPESVAVSTPLPIIFTEQSADFDTLPPFRADPHQREVSPLKVMQNCMVSQLKSSGK
jgi:hypothetical protein